MKVLNFSPSASMFCGSACHPVLFLPQFNEAVNGVDGKVRTANIQNIKKVDVIKHLSQIV